MKYIITFFLVFISIVSLAGGKAIDHAPIGVMGDHLHKRGEWMFSFRYIEMRMSDNLINGKSASTNDVLKQPNPFSSMPGMPPNLSVVPQKMSMRMIMPGLMYAPSNDITIMAMAMLEDKQMDLSVFQPMMNRNFLGGFKSSSNDLSDISVNALIRLQENPKSRGHLHIGLKKSIKNNEKKGVVLTPMNMRVSTILPYGMQISDNSTRVILGYTQVMDLNGFLWGNQVITQKILKRGDWSFGESSVFNTWVQKSLSDNVSISGRFHFEQQDEILGRNTSIIAPVQSANPTNYGGKVLSFGFGLNFISNILNEAGKDRLAIEFLMPIHQSKNMIQMKDKVTFLLGYQRSF